MLFRLFAAPGDPKNDAVTESKRRANRKGRGHSNPAPGPPLHPRPAPSPARAAMAFPGIPYERRLLIMADPRDKALQDYRKKLLEHKEIDGRLKERE